MKQPMKSNCCDADIGTSIAFGGHECWTCLNCGKGCNSPHHQEIDDSIDIMAMNIAQGIRDRVYLSHQNLLDTIIGEVEGMRLKEIDEKIKVDIFSPHKTMFDFERGSVYGRNSTITDVLAILDVLTILRNYKDKQ